jgi:Holliday junction resolvase
VTSGAVGANFERRVRAHLDSEGYVTARAAGSRGPFDLIAAKQGEVLLVQVKRRRGTIPPAERAELRRLALLAGGTPVVAHQPLPRGPIVLRELTGVGPKDWVTFHTDVVA